MAHYAFITNGIVTEVITGIDETELIEGLHPEIWYGNFRGQVCKRTSYNGNYRYNYAGIGYTLDTTVVQDGVIGVFYAPQPFPSWILDTQTYYWEAPVPYPNDGQNYTWDEARESWVLVP